jgi:hypothetical protein
MPILPLTDPVPFWATLGVMLYPGEDDAERRKAKAYAAHAMAEPLVVTTIRSMPYPSCLHGVVVRAGIVDHRASVCRSSFTAIVVIQMILVCVIDAVDVRYVPIGLIDVVV